MPGTNDFKGFALTATDTYTPAEWAALTALLANGFSTGVASTKQVNTALRQASSMTAALGKIISDAEINALDNGNVSALATSLLQALATQFAAAGSENTRPGWTYASNDWCWLDKARGLRLQWGTAGGLSVGNNPFSWPVAFTNTPFAAVCTYNYSFPTNADGGVGLISLSNVGGTARSSFSSASVSYLVIGV